MQMKMQVLEVFDKKMCSAGGGTLVVFIPEVLKGFEGFVFLESRYTNGWTAETAGE